MQIINIINFVRAVEPREEDDSYLPVTLEEELKLCSRYSFPSTVLLQYDALIDSRYIDIIRRYGKNAEIGLWFEIVEPLVKDCGMEWRGRFPWDWHNDVGFLIGYTPGERKILIDRAFEKFREVFGCYPQSAGSWHIDAFSLRYMSEKYGISASCNCKDQCGTDGYTMWGGYWSGAYYPCVNNMLCPASSPENQIDVPVFRMLGSDPIHQYDLGLGEPEKGQGVASLEPVYGNSGADRNWVCVFFDEMFNGKGLALSYAQMGQENSFGWEKIKKGLTMQFELLSDRLKKGDVQLLTLGESGRLFKEKYPSTPASSVCFDNDPAGGDYKTVWYMSDRYRVNILYRRGRIHIRDIFVFDDLFPEKYLTEKTAGNTCFFSNIPLVDGFRFSSRTKTAGAYFMKDGKVIDFDGDYVTDASGDTVRLSVGGNLFMCMKPSSLEINCGVENACLMFVFNSFSETGFSVISQRELRIRYMGFERSVFLRCGTFFVSGSEFGISPEDGSILFDFHNN